MDIASIIVHPKGIKPLVYSPWEENRFNMVNFLAVSDIAPDNLNSIVINK